MILLKYIVFLLIYSKLSLVESFKIDDITNGFQNLLNELQNQINEIQSNLTAPITDVDDLIDKYQDKLNTISKETLDKMPKENIKDLIESDSNKLNERIKQSLNCFEERKKKDFNTFEAHVRNLDSNEDDMSVCNQVVISDYDLSSITDGQVNRLGKDILNLDLQNLSTSAKEAVLDKIEDFKNSESDQDRKESLDYLGKALFWQVKTPPSRLSADQVESMSFESIIKNFNPQLVKMIPRTAFSELKKKIKNGGNIPPLLRRAILERYLEEDGGLKSLNATEFIKRYDEIPANVRKAIELEDLPKREQPRERGNIENRERNDAADGFVSLKTARKHMFDNVTSRSTVDLRLLGIANPAKIKDGIENGKITNSNKNPILKGMQVACGPGCKQKQKVVAKMIEKDKSEDEEPTFSGELKETLPHTSLNMLEKVSEEEARKLLKKTISFPPTERLTLLNKMANTNLGSLPPRIRSMLTHSMIRNKGGALSSISKGLPGSKSCSQLMENTMNSERNITADTVESESDKIHCIGIRQAMWFSNWTVLEALAKMKNEISRDACIVLYDKCAKMTMYSGSTDGSKEGMAKFFTEHDAHHIPLCIFANLGKHYRKLPQAMREKLLARLFKMQNPEYQLRRNARMIIIDGGMDGLQPGDMLKGGSNVPDLTGRIISNSYPTEAKLYLIQLQKWIKENGRFPCLDADQRSAIANTIKREFWSSGGQAELHMVNCLLPVLSDADLRSLQPESLAQASCIELDTNPNDPIEVECKADLGKDDYKQREGVRRLNKYVNEAARKIIEEEKKKRKNWEKDPQLPSWACEMAAILTPNGMTNNEIYNEVTADDIWSCPEFFGGTDMEMEKASHLLKKITDDDKKIADLTKEELLQLGYIIKAFSKKDIKKLPEWSYDEETTQLVSIIGKMEGLSDSVQTEYMKKIIEWRRPSSMSFEDLLKIGKLTCKFSKEDIRDINRDAIRDAMIELGQNTNCEMEYYEEMAKEASRIYNKFEGAEVREMGVILAGLSRSDLEDLGESGCEGVSPLAISKMSSSKLEALVCNCQEFLPQNVWLHMEKKDLEGMKCKKEALAQHSKHEEANAKPASALKASSSGFLMLLGITILSMMN